MSYAMEKEIILPRKEKANKGKLKIYLGYAAGVGKTFAMLSDAQALKKEGIDVVIGYVEDHKRDETNELVAGLEVIPPIVRKYQNTVVQEFDVDAALARKPELILVDELAHTNVEGSRHKKRYQDVEELLAHGIDVLTTVNVQHLESLQDQIALISGISVRERVPDQIFEKADQIELIDIEPEELIDRLYRGKIYKEAQAKRALENFFTYNKLTALREVALRKTADKVNKIAARSSEDTGETFIQSNEHLLVCLSPSATNQKVLRTAATMAKVMGGFLTAIYVETSNDVDMDEEEKELLKINMNLAEELGADIVTLYGEDVATQIYEYAKISSISKIVIGRTGSADRRFGRLSMVDKLLQMDPNIDVYIIPDKENEAVKARKRMYRKLQFSTGDFLRAMILFVAATVVAFGFDAIGLVSDNIVMVYLLGVLVCAIVTTGGVYSIVFSILSVIAFNYLFVAPRFSFNVYEKNYPVTLLFMLISAIITSTLTKKMKKQGVEFATRAYRTEILLETSQKLQNAIGANEILQETGQQLAKLLKHDIYLYQGNGDNGMLQDPILVEVNMNIVDKVEVNDNERAVANWVFNNGKRAGATTNTLSAAKGLYLAIRSRDKVYAVMGILIGKKLDVFEKNVMIALLAESAMALEKEDAHQNRQEVAIKMEQEQLRGNLLRSISHDLRTPLTSISGNASILIKEVDRLDDKKRMEIYNDIYDDSAWLIKLVENLLSITKINDGKLNLHFEVQLMDEIIGEALLHLDRRHKQHHIDLNLGDELILVEGEARLLIQVIANLVNNAIYYTPPKSNITITLTREGKYAKVLIADDGPGIPPKEKAHIFDMFYTLDVPSMDSRRGLGLGLPLCKAIIEAHGGKIGVKDCVPHGTCFYFTLPVKESKEA